MSNFRKMGEFVRIQKKYRSLIQAFSRGGYQLYTGVSDFKNSAFNTGTGTAQVACTCMVWLGTRYISGLQQLHW